MRMATSILLLSLCFASTAVGGGLHARIDGPAADGTTYTARTVGGDGSEVLEPWAHAEGVVDGVYQSVLIRLEPTGKPGEYRFQRTWPKEGHWAIRYCLGVPPAPATVVSLKSDGRVGDHELYYKSDGHEGCARLLKKWQKPGQKDC